MSEVWNLGEKTRRVLQASAVEAFGREGVYVTMRGVIERANISDPEEFQTVARYLEEQGLIAEADADYGASLSINQSHENRP